MKYRKLRIGWSVAWGVLCLILIVLWVRSYWYEDVAFIVSGGHRSQVMSHSGGVGFARVEEKGTESHYHTGPIINPSTTVFKPQFSFLGLVCKKQSNATTVRLPYWLLAASSACLAGAIWRDWHFSLRTLLIGMTLVAVALGLILALSR